MAEETKSETSSYEGRRMRGILDSMPNSGAGYGFASMGRGQPQVFIQRSQVPPKFWLRGTMLEFDLLPPRPGTRAMRAANIAVIDYPSEESEPCPQSS